MGKPDFFIYLSEFLLFFSGQDNTKVAVLNVFSDYDYNRSVITIAGSADHIGENINFQIIFIWCVLQQLSISI